MIMAAPANSAMKAGIPVGEAIARYAQPLFWSDTTSDSTSIRAPHGQRLLKDMARSQAMIRKLYDNGTLTKRVSKHWYDPGVELHLTRLHGHRHMSKSCNTQAAHTTYTARSRRHTQPGDWLTCGWTCGPSHLMKEWVETKGKKWPVVPQQNLMISNRH